MLNSAKCPVIDRALPGMGQENSACKNSEQYPLQQAQFVLPKETKFAGLKLRAEIEVKGMCYPVQWACRQKLNEDGSLTLRSNLHHGF